MDRLKVRQPSRIFLVFLLIFSLIIGFSLGLDKVKAAPVYDQDNGTWTDGYADSTGLSSKSNMNVDTSDGKLKLTNASGGFTPPYNTSGWAITTSIIPTSVAEWGGITFTASTSANTSIEIQVVDEANRVYSDSLLSGNESGFTSSPIDISSLPVIQAARYNSAKFARIRFKYTFSTSDTDFTPDIDSISLSWTVRQGDTSASTLANTAWPIIDINKEGTRHSAYYNSQIYPAIRWIKDQGVSYSGIITRGSGETIFSKNQGTLTINSVLSALNRNTGETSWEKTMTGYAYSECEHTLSQNGTLYLADIFSDILLAFDTSDGSLKWTHQFYASHGNDHVAIADDGTLYTARYNGSFTIYAFNPDGTTKWTKSVDPPGTYVAVSNISLGSDGTLYFGTVTYEIVGPDAVYTGYGELYALNPDDGSINWEYPTGDIASVTPIVDTDGTIYTAHSVFSSTEKKIFAINSDGTLKWEYSIGTSTDLWRSLSLRSDGLLLALRSVNWGYYSQNSFIDAINTSDGSLAWSRDNQTSYYQSIFTDSQNGYYYLDRPGLDYQEGDSTPDSVNLYYFDSSRNEKWRMVFDSSAGLYNFIMDEDGRLYGYYQGSTLKLMAVYPWSLSAGINQWVYSPGEIITFTVTTSMQETNLLTGAANQIQAVMDNGDKAALSYDSTNSDGDTVWTGTYRVLSGQTTGVHSFTIEANAAGIQTDTGVDFDSPATNSNNTGITTTANFYIYNPPHVDPEIKEITSPLCGKASPLAPTSLRGIPGPEEDEVTLYWEKPSSGRVSHYALVYGFEPGRPLYGLADIGNQTSATVTGLSSGTGYYFMVAGVNDCASSPFSNELLMITKGWAEEGGGIVSGEEEVVRIANERKELEDEVVKDVILEVKPAFLFYFSQLYHDLSSWLFKAK